MKGKEYLIIGSDNGYTYKFTSTVYSDDGNPIPMRVKTKYYSLSDASRVKILKKTHIQAQSPNGIIVSVSTKDIDGYSDYEPVEQVLKTNQQVDVYKKGNSFSLGFDDYSTYPAEIENFKFFFKDTKETY